MCFLPLWCQPWCIIDSLEQRLLHQFVDHAGKTVDRMINKKKISDQLVVMMRIGAVYYC